MEAVIERSWISNLIKLGWNPDSTTYWLHNLENLLNALESLNGSDNSLLI